MGDLGRRIPESITGNYQARSGLVLRGRTHGRRVLRGGSFNNNDQNVRCAYRNRNNPDNRNRNIGFRVVASTLFKARDLSLPELPSG
jgi:formylglycine-generating enzyme required for sulfatase activity